MWSRYEEQERSRELDDPIGRDDSVIGWKHSLQVSWNRYDKEKQTNVVRSKRWCFDAKAILT